MAAKYSRYTNTEHRHIRNLHANGRVPTLIELGRAFPRHTAESVAEIARQMGLRPTWDHLDLQRLQKARAYLAARPAAVLAYLGIAVPEAAE